jgi:hypothetical protein
VKVMIPSLVHLGHGEKNTTQRRFTASVHISAPGDEKQMKPGTGEHGLISMPIDILQLLIQNMVRHDGPAACNAIFSLCNVAKSPFYELCQDDAWWVVACNAVPIPVHLRWFETPSSSSQSSQSSPVRGVAYRCFQYWCGLPPKYRFLAVFYAWAREGRWDMIIELATNRSVLWHDTNDLEAQWGDVAEALAIAWPTMIPDFVSWLWKRNRGPEMGNYQDRMHTTIQRAPTGLLSNEDMRDTWTVPTVHGNQVGRLNVVNWVHEFNAVRGVVQSVLEANLAAAFIKGDVLSQQAAIDSGGPWFGMTVYRMYKRAIHMAIRDGLTINHPRSHMLFRFFRSFVVRGAAVSVLDAGLIRESLNLLEQAVKAGNVSVTSHIFNSWAELPGTRRLKRIVSHAMSANRPQILQWAWNLRLGANTLVDTTNVLDAVEAEACDALLEVAQWVAVGEPTMSPQTISRAMEQLREQNFVMDKATQKAASYNTWLALFCMKNGQRQSAVEHLEYYKSERWWESDVIGLLEDISTGREITLDVALLLWKAREPRIELSSEAILRPST